MPTCRSSAGRWGTRTLRSGGPGRALTIAAFVLALSFGLLAIVPLRPFREIALATGLGLLIDAFVVRTVLVPAVIALVGERSAWPGHRLAGSPRDGAAGRLR